MDIRDIETDLTYDTIKEDLKAIEQYGYAQAETKHVDKEKLERIQLKLKASGSDMVISSSGCMEDAGTCTYIKIPEAVVSIGADAFDKLYESGARSITITGGHNIGRVSDETVSRLLCNGRLKRFDISSDGMLYIMFNAFGYNGTEISIDTDNIKPSNAMAYFDSMICEWFSFEGQLENGGYKVSIEFIQKLFARYCEFLKIVLYSRRDNEECVLIGGSFVLGMCKSEKKRLLNEAASMIQRELGIKAYTVVNSISDEESNILLDKNISDAGKLFMQLLTGDKRTEWFLKEAYGKSGEYIINNMHEIIKQYKNARAVIDIGVIQISVKECMLEYRTGMSFRAVYMPESREVYVTFLSDSSVSLGKAYELEVSSVWDFRNAFRNKYVKISRFIRLVNDEW